MNTPGRPTRHFVCIVDLPPSGRVAALPIDARDALDAERIAQLIGAARFHGPVEVLEVMSEVDTLAEVWLSSPG